MHNKLLHLFIVLFFGYAACFAQADEQEGSVLANPNFDQFSNNSIFDSQPISGSDWEWMHPTPQGNNYRFLKVWDANNWYALGYSGMFVKTSDAGATWFVNKNVGGLSSVAAGNNLFGGYFLDMNNGLACGENGVIVRTSDAGVTWNSVYTGSGFIYDIYFINATVGFACGVASNGFLKTTDAGLTWAPLPSVVPGNAYCIYAFDENNIILGSATGNTLKTTDGGTTWATIYAAGTSLIWSIDFMDANTGMVGGIDAALAFTTDAGATWTVANTGIPATSDFFDMDYRQNRFYATGDPFNLYYTTDLGTSWNAIANTGSAPWTASIFKSGFITDDQLVSAGTSGIIKRTTISTLTTVVLNNWLKAGIAYDNWAESSTGRVIAVGSTGASTTSDQVIYSTNGGEDWALGINSTPGLAFYSLSMVSPLIGYAACADVTVYKTTDGGANWFLVTQPAVSTSDLRAASFLDENNGYVFGASGLGYKTTDGGTTWTTLPTGVTATLYGSHFLDANTGFICGASGNLLKTTDGGATFTALNPNNTSTLYSVYMVNANVGYVSGSSGRVRKTTDGGTTWSTIDVGNTSPTLYDIQFRDENNGITCGSTGRVYSTTDGGTTWNFENTGASTLYSVYIEKASTGISSVYLSGSGGLVQKNSNLIVPVELTSFTASVSGNEITLNWSTATELNNQGFEIQKKSADGEFEKIAFVAGFGTTSESKSYSYKDINSLSGKVVYRLKQIDFDGTFEYSNAIEVDFDLTPNEYSLNQNYPNPFNPSTIINYAVKEAGLVKIKVFDILGSEVAELVNETKEAGNFSVNFSATGGAVNLPSGVYLYTMQVNNFTSSQKMLLLK